MTPETALRLRILKQRSAFTFEKCRQQRIVMMCEREALKISRALRQHADRVRMRKAIQREADVVARRLVATIEEQEESK